jgi:AcrR family transcriptional regulator
MSKANETKRKILRCAEKQFCGYGYQKTTIRLLAEAAQVNIAAINHYYGTKERLYKCIFARRLSQLNKRLNAVKADPEISTLAYLELIAHALIKFEAGKQDFMKLFFRELSILPYSVCKFSILRFLKQTLSTISHTETIDKCWTEYRSGEQFQLYFQLLYSVHPALRHSSKLERFLSIESHNKFQVISQRIKAD